MKFILALFLAFFLPAVAIAQSDVKDAKHMATDFLNIYFTTINANELSPNALSLAYQWEAENEMPIYCFTFTIPDNGFIIVHTDTTVGILGFSTKSAFKKEHLPPAMNLLLEEYRFIKPEKEDKKGNNQLQNTQHVTPLLTTSWDQRCYYNDSCPADSMAPAYFCNRAPAGCVASALGQIMHYHQWPYQGIGTNSYYDADYGTLSANFGNTTYNWQGMPNTIYTSNPEIARLMFHVGVATEMNYGPFASGTGASDAHYALKTYFNYKNSTQHVYKVNYTSTSWKSMLQNELDHGRPVFYGGVDAGGGGGHAFVCDGYYGNDYFHINWGWSGTGDGYFMLSNLNPLGSANYINMQEAIIGIEPNTPQLNAAFTASANNIDAGDAINFSNLSQGPHSVYQWRFDGAITTISTLKNPVNIIYNTPGIFDVELIIGDGTSFDTLLKTNYITVKPFADFIADRREIATGQSINFNALCLASNPITQYNWYFHGGTPQTSALPNPQDITWNNPGQFPVLLEITSNGKTHKQLKTKYITVHNHCDTMLWYYFPGYDIQTANQASFTVNQEDLDGLIPYHHPYISSGWDVFNEQLSTGDTNWFISATSLFQTTGTANNWLTFGPVTIPSAGAVLQWKQQYPDHTKRDGYEILVNENGLTHQHFTGSPLLAIADNDPSTVGDTIWTSCSLKFDSITYGGKEIYIAFHHNAHNMFYIAFDDIRIYQCSGFPLYADFLAIDSIIPAGQPITFYDISSGTPTSWSWSFPGGQPANAIDEDPSVIYSTPGIYNVTLDIGYDGGVQKSITKQNYIHVITSVSQPMKNKKFVVIPNPVDDHLVIMAKKNSFNHYKLYDMRGKLIYAGDLKEGESLHMQHTDSGIYLLHLYLNNTLIGITKVLKR